jgi:predicted RNase H-like nuclease (RuvC/YqgF family)
MVELRVKASRKRWEEKVQNSPEMRLHRANKRIKELEAEVERLKKEIFNLGDHISKA